MPRATARQKVVVKNAKQAVRAITTRKEADDFVRRLRKQMKTSGQSAIERQLIDTAVNAVKEQVTKGEGRGVRRVLNNTSARKAQPPEAPSPRTFRRR